MGFPHLKAIWNPLEGHRCQSLSKNDNRYSQARQGQAERHAWSHGQSQQQFQKLLSSANGKTRTRQTPNSALFHKCHRKKYSSVPINGFPKIRIKWYLARTSRAKIVPKKSCSLPLAIPYLFSCRLTRKSFCNIDNEWSQDWITITRWTFIKLWRTQNSQDFTHIRKIQVPHINITRANFLFCRTDAKQGKRQIGPSIIFSHWFF